MEEEEDAQHRMRLKQEDEDGETMKRANVLYKDTE